MEETNEVPNMEEEDKDEKMETDSDLRLVLEETQPQPEPPLTSTSTDGKKRAPLVTLISGNIAQQGGKEGGGATPEKPKGRRVNLITLSSPKTK